MDSDKLEDLKQFIDSRISQLELRFDLKLDELHNEISEGFAGVGDAIEEVHARAEEKNTIVNERLAKLEQQAARS